MSTADPWLFEARDLALDLALARDLDRRRAGARELARDLGRARGRARDLTQDRDLARDLAGNLDRALGLRHGLARGQRRAKHVVLPAAHLVAVAARLVPAADRARYAEEYRSELWDLAHTGAGRWPQLRYALRQLCNASRTSSALRAPRRRSAVP